MDSRTLSLARGWVSVSLLTLLKLPIVAFWACGSKASEDIVRSGGGYFARCYILHNLLGIGGMRSVYSAAERLNGKEVAIMQMTASALLFYFASRSIDCNLTLVLAHEFRTMAVLRPPVSSATWNVALTSSVSFSLP